MKNLTSGEMGDSLLEISGFAYYALPWLGNLIFAQNNTIETS